MGEIRKTAWERNRTIIQAIREFENQRWRNKPTMTDIAYKLKLRPSTYLLDKLKLLEASGAIVREEQPYRNKKRFVWMTTEFGKRKYWLAKS